MPADPVNRELIYWLQEEDRIQAEEEAKELFGSGLLKDFALFSIMAQQWMDEAGNLGQFVDWAWNRHKRNANG